MANKEHLEKLNAGKTTWNSWMQSEIPYGIDIEEAVLQEINIPFPDLSYANLAGKNLGAFDLRRANLKGTILDSSILVNADLRHANLSNSTLNNSNLIGAILENANLENTILRGGDLRMANLKFAYLHGADLEGADLMRANLSIAGFVRANLSKAYLAEANLTAANLSYANLEGANLYAVQALGTNFCKAKFTGACIRGWNIDSSTKLKSIDCKYIYLDFDIDDRKFYNRRPHSLSRMYKDGEFTRRFEILEDAYETIDLTFTEGIDWQDFFSSLQEVRSQNPGTGIYLQGIEDKQGQYAIRLRIETEATGKARTVLEAKIETITMELYEAKRELHEAHGENKALKWSLEETLKRPTYDFRYSQWAGGFAEKIYGDQSGGTLSTYAVLEQQIMIGAVAEILAVLQQFKQTNPTATLEEQTAFVNMAIPPSRRERLLGVLQSVGEAALQELPYGNVIKAIIEGWQDPG